MIAFHLENALRRLRRSPATTIVIVTSIALGIAVTMTMIAFYSGMNVDPLPHKNERLHRVLLDNWTAEKPYADPDLAPPALTLQDTRALRDAQVGAEHALHYHSVAFVAREQAAVKRKLKVSTRAANAGFFKLFEPPFQYGAAWRDVSGGTREQVAVIARTLNERLFGGSDSVGQQIEVNGVPFRIVGVLDQWDVYPLFYDMTREDLVGDDLFVPFDVAIETLKLWPSFSASPVASAGKSFDENFTGGQAVFVQFWVDLESPAALDDYRRFLAVYLAEQRRLGRFPRNAPPELLAIPEWIERQQKTGNQSVFMLTLIAVGLLFFGVCLLNIVTLMITRFMGNAGSVSVMRALGAPRSSVFVEHMLEAGLLGVIGGALGLALTRVGVELLGPLFLGVDEGGTGASLAGATDFAALLSGEVLLLGVCIAILGALLVALYPTWKVCRIAPTQYLKSL